MKILVKLLYIITVIIIISIIGYYDFSYNKSFYHSLMIIALIIITYCTYKIHKIVEELLRIHKKWLGN